MGERVNAIVFVAVGAAAGHENLSGFERGAALAGYRHYKRSTRRTWRHPPDASVRQAAQRARARAQAGLGTAARRAQSAQRTRRCKSAAHRTQRTSFVRASGKAREGRGRKRKARVRVTERTSVRGPNGRKEKARWGARERASEREKKEREGERTGKRADGQTDGWTGERARARTVAAGNR